MPRVCRGWKSSRRSGSRDSRGLAEAISLEIRGNLIVQEFGREGAGVDAVSKLIVKAFPSATESKKLFAHLRERTGNHGISGERLSELEQAVGQVFKLRRGRARARRDKKPIEEFIYSQVSQLGGTEEEHRLVAKAITDRYYSDLQKQVQDS